LRPGDLVDGRVEFVASGGDEDAGKGTDELAVELGTGRGAEKVSSLEILHEVAGSAEVSGSTGFAPRGRGRVLELHSLLGASFGDSASDDIGDDVARLQNGE
jgi:hypothetical protein